MEKNSWLRALIILGVLFLGVQLFSIVWNFARQFADIILIFLLAWLIAFLLNPAVQFFTITRKTPRILAVGAVYLTLLAILVIAGLLLIPPTASQISTLGNRFPQYANNISALADRSQAWFNSHGIPVEMASLASSSELLARAQAIGAALAENALGLAQSVALAIFDGVIILIVSVYITLDGERMTNGILRVVPAQYRSDADLLLASVDRSFGGFLRASFILTIVYAVGTALAMFILGVPFALPVGIFAGVMLVIPFVGDIVAVIPPVALALVSVPPLHTLFLLVFMILLQQLVLQVLRPRIMGQEVGLHPLFVLASFLIGARVAGIWGALFSVPVAAILQTVVQIYYYRAAGNVAEEGTLTRSILAGHEHYEAMDEVEKPVDLNQESAITPGAPE
jgi:predicted PurR-regulated permease PerM